MRPRATTAGIIFGIILGSLPTAKAVAAADVATGLVGYWKLDEATPTGLAADSSATAANGTYLNGPTASPDIPAPIKYADARSVLFSKATMQAVRVVNAPAALKPQAVTLAAWFKLRTMLTGTGVATGQAEVVSLGDQTLLRVYSNMVGTAKRVTGNTWVSFNVAATPNDLAWHHLAATIDTARISVYLDGRLVGTLADPMTLPILYDLGADLWIGRHGLGTGRDFDGNIDEVAVWARVLSAEDVAALAAGSQPGAPGADGGTDGAVTDAGAGGSDARADAGGGAADAAADAPPASADAGGSSDVAPPGDADDAAEADAGSPPDAAGAAADRGRVEGGRPPPPAGSGCGCALAPARAVAGVPPPLAFVLLAAAALALRRARRS